VYEGCGAAVVTGGVGTSGIGFGSLMGFSRLYQCSLCQRKKAITASSEKPKLKPISRLIYEALRPLVSWRGSFGESGPGNAGIAKVMPEVFEEIQVLLRPGLVGVADVLSLYVLSL